MLALFIVWLLGAIFVLVVKVTETLQDPALMPGGGWPAIIATALLWPAILVVGLFAMLLGVIGVL
jgi:hypothetical protein